MINTSIQPQQSMSVNQVPGARYSEQPTDTGGLNQTRNWYQNRGGGTWTGGRTTTPGGAGATGAINFGSTNPAAATQPGPLSIAGGVNPTGTNTVAPAPATTGYNTTSIPQINAYGTTWDSGTWSGQTQPTMTAPVTPAPAFPAALAPVGVSRMAGRGNAGPTQVAPVPATPISTSPYVISPGYSALFPSGGSKLGRPNIDPNLGRSRGAYVEKDPAVIAMNEAQRNSAYAAATNPLRAEQEALRGQYGVAAASMPRYIELGDMLYSYQQSLQQMPGYDVKNPYQAQIAWTPDMYGGYMSAAQKNALFDAKFRLGDEYVNELAKFGGDVAAYARSLVPGISESAALQSNFVGPTQPTQPAQPAATAYTPAQQNVQDLYQTVFGANRAAAPEMGAQAGQPGAGYAEGGPVRGYAEGSLVDLSDRYGLMPDYVTLPDDAKSTRNSVTLPDYGQPADIEFMAIPASAQAPAQAPAQALAQALAQAPAQPPTTPTLAPEQALNQMLQKYISGEGGMYGAELRKARTAAEKETAAFNDVIQRALEAKGDTGPSREEMYFRLAAAMGKPTRTGRFAENLGEAAGVMGEVSRERRAAEKANQAEALQLTIAAQKARAEAAKSDLSNLRSLAGEEMRDVRSLALKEIERQIAAGKPQSEAGKVAVDSGLKPGTPEYQQFVDKYVADKLTSGNLFKEAMVAVAQGQLGVAQAKEQRARATEAKKETTLTPVEVKMRDETEREIAASTSALSALSRAYELNPNTFTASGPDVAQRKLLELSGKPSEKLTNTRVMENLLGGQALEQLKVIFGAAPTEGERAILLDLQGMGAKSVDERAEIIKRTAQLVRQREVRAKRKLEEIRSGRYKSTTSSETEGAE